MQLIMDRFASACKRFGLTISLGKTKSMYQPARAQHSGNPSPPAIKIDDTEIKSVDKFCYLGSTICSSGTLDAEVTLRIAKASAAFGRLNNELWNDKGITFSTKINTYRAVLLTTLLYCCETWTTYRRHIQQLEQFHQRCLRKILNIRWQDRVSNLQVLEKSGLPSIESLLIQRQLRWTGHVVRMSDSRIPKMLLYGQLKEGHRDLGRPHKRFKDTLKTNLKVCDIDIASWESEALGRSRWRQLSSRGTKAFERKRTLAIQEKRERRKQGKTSGEDFPCNTCGKCCASRIGLYSHMRTHTK